MQVIYVMCAGSRGCCSYSCHNNRICLQIPAASIGWHGATTWCITISLNLHGKCFVSWKESILGPRLWSYCKHEVVLYPSKSQARFIYLVPSFVSLSMFRFFSCLQLLSESTLFDTDCDHFALTFLLADHLLCLYVMNRTL